MEKSQVKWLYISVGFSFLVLVIILFLTINENTIQYLQQVNPVFLLLAFLTHILSMCFWAWRVQKMSGSLGYRIGFFYSLNLVFANLLAAAITPSQAGGEPVRIHELYRAKVPLGDATAIVIVERVLDGIVLAILAAFAMIVLADQWKSLGAVSQIITLITWIFVIGCLLLFYLAIRRPDVVKRVIHRIACFFTRTWEVTRVEAFTRRADKEIDNFNGAVIKFVKSAKGGLLWGLLFSLLYWISEILIASLILLGLGQPPIILESFVIQTHPRNPDDDPAHPGQFPALQKLVHIRCMPCSSLLQSWEYSLSYGGSSSFTLILHSVFSQVSLSFAEKHDARNDSTPTLTLITDYSNHCART